MLILNTAVAKLFRKCLPLIILLSLAKISASQPVINSISPLSGNTGSTVVISGSNFSSNAAENIVYFGATRASVSDATSTALNVVVPVGATYGPLNVSIAGQTAYSAQFFMPTFTGLGIFNTNSFEASKSFPSNASVLGLSTGDIDGDGKADLAAVSTGVVSAFRNTSSTGSVTFAGKQDFIAGTGSRQVKLADISGDGNADIITANYAGSSISVLTNTSSAGNISFAAKIDLVAGPSVKSVAASDFDYDGRIDIVCVNEAAGTISVFRNTTVGGVISFAPKIDYISGDSPGYVAVGDIDGDGKTDIAVVNADNTRIALFRNTSTAGVMSFEAAVNVVSGFLPGHITLADLDQDGKLDMITSQEQFSSIYVDVYRNTSVPGTFSFGPNQPFNVNITGVAGVGDVNGDSKPDLVVGNSQGNWVSVLRNTSTSGTISFAGYIQFPIGNPSAIDVAISDLDGDGKPDIAATNRSATNVTVIRNATDEPLVVASGASPVTGIVNKSATLDATVQTRNGSPYVQRHFDITPVNNPATATGTITLHFTQQDFDQFNAHPAHGGNLPSNSADNIGKANLRVFQFHGTSSSGLPGTYSGSGVEIDPADASIVWDAANFNWRVTFNVTGFSGFFVSSAGNNILPLTLVSFGGKLEGDKALLKWTTTDEDGVDYFEVLHSTDGSVFKPIAKIDAKGNTNSVSVYDYTDNPEMNSINYYRLKIIDIDGSYEYSKVINLKAESGDSRLILYPNPASGFVQVFHPAIRNKGNIQVYDVSGRMIRSVQLARDAQFTRIDLGGVAKGIYTVVIKEGGWMQAETIIVK